MKMVNNLMWFVVYVLFGAYFINFGLGLYVLPEFILNINKWVVLIGGVLILWGGINHYKAKKKV